VSVARELSWSALSDAVESLLDGEAPPASLPEWRAWRVKWTGNLLAEMRRRTAEGRLEPEAADVAEPARPEPPFAGFEPTTTKRERLAWIAELGPWGPAVPPTDFTDRVMADVVQLVNDGQLTPGEGRELLATCLAPVAAPPAVWRSELPRRLEPGERCGRYAGHPTIGPIRSTEAGGGHHFRRWRNSSVERCAYVEPAARLAFIARRGDSPVEPAPAVVRAGDEPHGDELAAAIAEAEARIRRALAGENPDRVDEYVKRWRGVRGRRE